MTSKRCFFKYMGEDFKHKSWMLALSVLGNMLAMPIAFLILIGRNMSYMVTDVNQEALRAFRTMGNILTFFDNDLYLTGGFIAVGGAVIVGLASFRHLHNKRMADTYESIPLSRNQRFLAGYLNGIIMWLVPYLVGLAVALILAMTRYYKALAVWNSMPESVRGALKNMTEVPAGGEIILEAVKTTGILLLVYLLVLHFILVIVNLTGNILNTLVLMGALGAGALAVYGCFTLCGEYYLSTYFYRGLETVGTKISLCLSPFALVVMLFCQGIGRDIGGNLYLIASVVMTLVLGIGAFFLFRNRASEMAEQGLRNKALRLGIQYLVSIIGGIGGWFVFDALVNVEKGTAQMFLWDIFGAVLVAVLAFGVLDIIFSMDFKAFAKNWKFMIGAVLTPILICFAFYFDVFGYDTYLPKEDDIESLAVADSCFSIYNYYVGDTFANGKEYLGNRQIQSMEYKNPEVIHSFLETAIKQSTQDKTSESAFQNDAEKVVIDYAYPEEPEVEYTRRDVTVRVKLTNGKTYYRSYNLDSRFDNSAYYQILTSPEYVEKAYVVPEFDVNQVNEVNLSGDEIWIHAYPGVEDKKGKTISMDTVMKIVEAYNQDIVKRPELIVDNQGHGVSNMRLYVHNGDSSEVLRLIFCTEMEEVMRVFQENDLEAYARRSDVDAIERVEIDTGFWYSPDSKQNTEESLQNLLSILERRFGVEYDENKPLDVEKVRQQMEEDVEVNWQLMEKEREFTISLTVKNPEDIVYLYEHSRMDYAYETSIFHTQLNFPYIIATDENDMTHSYVLDQGALPEKYMDYFRVIRDILLENTPVEESL